ncbi:MAG: hypothetical protein HFI78_00005 [Lachnospiraceae bacterium]|nr:hypothetical protein [Lachnospiraceae bacterium]
MSERKEKSLFFQDLPLDKSHFITGGNSISDLHQFNENLDKIYDIHNFEVCLGIKNNLVEINEDKMILTDDLNNIELLEQEQFNKIIREELHIEFVGNE